MSYVHRQCSLRIFSNYFICLFSHLLIVSILFFLWIEFLLKKVGQVFHLLKSKNWVKINRNSFMHKIVKKTVIVSLLWRFYHIQVRGKSSLVFFVTVSKNNSYSGCSSNSECSGPTPVCRQGQCVPGLL